MHELWTPLTFARCLGIHGSHLLLAGAAYAAVCCSPLSPLSGSSPPRSCRSKCSGSPSGWELSSGTERTAEEASVTCSADGGPSEACEFGALAKSGGGRHGSGRRASGRSGRKNSSWGRPGWACSLPSALAGKVHRAAAEVDGTGPQSCRGMRWPLRKPLDTSWARLEDSRCVRQSRAPDPSLHEGEVRALC